MDIFLTMHEDPSACILPLSTCTCGPDHAWGIMRKEKKKIEKKRKKKSEEKKSTTLIVCYVTEMNGLNEILSYLNWKLLSLIPCPRRGLSH